MLNYLTYNGTKSTDLGVYVTGSGSFDAAEMDADKYEIAGRNGDLIIPKNRYKNIVVNYPAFIPKAFQNKAQSIRNWMRSAKAYARLEDTYDMEHFRLGLASGIQSFEPVNRNDASNFQLSFDCRPERFLKTGETPLTIEPEAHSYSGEIVEFETVAVDDMTKAEVSLSPIQSLNGYDHPWAGGAGKNKWDFGNPSSATNATVTLNSDGTFAVDGSAANSKLFYLVTGLTANQAYSIMIKKSGDSGNVSVLGYATVYDGSDSTATVLLNNASTTSRKSFTPTGNAVYISFSVTGGSGSGSSTVSEPTIEAGSSITSYEPYENLCPISGHTGATLNVGAEYPTADETYPVTFGQTVYGGTFDFVSGKLEITHEILDLGTLTWNKDSGRTGNFYTSNITGTPNDHFVTKCSAYLVNNNRNANNIENGELSSNNTYGGHRIFVKNVDRDSMTGAQFATYISGTTMVYELATPVEIDLTPEEVATLLGLNNVWASEGTVEIEYADPFNVDNPTFFASRPLFEITNPAQNDVLNVNGKTITFLSGYTGTVTIDCETMNCYSGYTNLNYLVSATDFPVLNEGLNIVTWSGSGTCTMTPRWWEL